MILAAASGKPKYPPLALHAGQDLEAKFRFRLDAEASSVTFQRPDEFVIAADSQPIICASAPFRGAFAVPKSSRIVDSSLRKTIEEAVQRGSNFAGHYSLVQFQIGEGPIGVLVVDAKSGSIFKLPQELVREDYFLYDTGCLDLFKATNLAREASPLSFQPDSELLIVRRCVPGGVEKSYLRWHRNRWNLIQRLSLPSPPPRPGH